MSGIYFLNGYLRPASERDPLRTFLRKALKEIDVDPDDSNVRYYSQNESTAIPEDVIADTDINIYLGIFENGDLQKIYLLDHKTLNDALKDKGKKGRDTARINPSEDWVKDKEPVWPKEDK